MEQSTSCEPAESIEFPENLTVSSTDLFDGYKALTKPQMSKSLHESSLHSRDTRNNTSYKIQEKADQKGKKKRNNNKPDETPMGLRDDPKEDEDILLGTPRKKSRGIYYNPLLYYTSSTGKTYYSKYFRPIHMTIGCC